MMRKILISILLVLVLALSPLTVFAADTYTEGTLYYTIDKGSVTITGCFATTATVTVPSGIAGYPVNTIAEGAFANNTSVKTVILPDSVTSVEEGAFAEDQTYQTATQKTVAVTGVSLSQSSISLKVGNSTTLTAAISPSNATNTSIIWTSTNTDVATVSNGTVSAVAAGSATITVCSVDGEKSATCAVTVTSDQAADTGADTVSVDEAEGSIGVADVSVDEAEVDLDADDSAASFADVPAKVYYASAVDWAVEMGITSGTSATTFSPNATCTRAQIVTFLWRAAGSPRVSGKNPFRDVSSSDYFVNAVLWAAEQGITTGTSTTEFSPDASCTRAQIVTFLWRYMGQKQGSGSRFADVASNAYYANAVNWAVSKGVTSGTSSTTFSPNKPCTRAEAVTFLYRAIN